jgi:hypothetical protein
MMLHVSKIMAVKTLVQKLSFFIVFLCPSRQILERFY